MGGHLLESSATGRHMTGRRLGTMLYGTVSRTGRSTVAPHVQHAPTCWNEHGASDLISHHELTEKRRTCRSKAGMPAPLPVLQRREGPAFDGRSIPKHLQSQTVSEPEEVEGASGEFSIQISKSLKHVFKSLTKSAP